MGNLSKTTSSLLLVSVRKGKKKINRGTLISKDKKERGKKKKRRGWGGGIEKSRIFRCGERCC